MKIFRLLSATALLVAPLSALAQTGINTSYLTPYSNGIIGVVNNILVPTLMAIAFIVFLWGVYKYFILGAADETSRTDGRQFTLWGIIGFVVILSLWGLVNLLMGTFGLSPGIAAPPPPTFGTGSYSPAGNTGGGLFGTAPANAALLQQYTSMQTACANPTSAACINAINAYSQALYAAYPSINSGATSCEATGGAWNLGGQCCSTDPFCSSTGAGGGNAALTPLETCINNGTDPAICQCELVTGGIWNFTTNACSSDTGATGGGGMPSQYQWCLNQGTNPVICSCEANGGSWNLTDQVCVWY